jgi:hypothetical protein
MRLPPKYSSDDEANPYPDKCPDTDWLDLDATEDPALYDDAPLAASPILEQASGKPSLS